ncbi:MAG: EthD family reductase [Alphaproteobacteria bacterium]|jgi:uncharacterized protein (TIGR02118 family)|nr:EthD family reductase [Alphaproteobacteria bacterium]
MIKRISLLTRKPGLSREEFNDHWLKVHAPFVDKLPGVIRYVQNHIADDAHRHDLPSGGQAVDGIVELWFEDVESRDAAFATKQAKEAWADGALFIGSVTTFVIEEHLLIDNG